MTYLAHTHVVVLYICCGRSCTTTSHPRLLHVSPLCTLGADFDYERCTLCVHFPKIPRSRPRRLTYRIVWKRHMVSWYVWKSVQFGVHLSDRTRFLWITVLSVKFLSNRRKRNAQRVLPVSFIKIAARVSTHVNNSMIKPIWVALASHCIFFISSVLPGIV